MNNYEVELAALREELAHVIEDRALVSAHVGNLKARAEIAERYSRGCWMKLTAAEQRNAELTELLNFAGHHLDASSFNSVGDVIEHTEEMRNEFIKKIAEALAKPTESGASE
jgi:hypothetical protein